MPIRKTKRILQGILRDRRGMAAVAGGHEKRIAQYRQLIQTKKHDLLELEERIKLDKQAGFETAELETQKAGVEQELDELNKMIEFQEEQAKQDAENNRKEAVLGAVGMAGPWGKVASMVGEKKLHADEASQEKSAEAAEGRMEKALEGAENKAGASAAKAASASAARLPPAATAPTQSTQPRLTGNAGLAQNIASGNMPSGSGGATSGVSPISVIIVIVCVVGATWLLRVSASPSITSVLPFALVIAAVIMWEKTPSPHAWYIIIIVILMIGASAYFGSSTYAYAKAAITTGSAQQSVTDTAASAKTTTSSVIKDMITNYQNQMAYATGQRVEGEVKEDQADTGIEILPPLVSKGEGSSITVTDKEAKYLDVGARVKGVDAKTPIKVGVTCHLKNKSSISVTTSTGPDLSPGTEQTKVKPNSIEGYSFTRDVTCYPTIDLCGSYILTFSAQADKLRTDAEKIDNIIDKEVLSTALNNYAAANKELTSSSQIQSAINTIYKGQLYSYKSKSDKGSIKVVMSTQDTPLIGVDKDTELKLLVGIENAKSGWIIGVNKVEITIPGYLTPLSGYCDSWESKDGKLIIKSDWLKEANFKTLSKGQQKLLPSCLLTIDTSSTYTLTEPTQATFLALVDYNYIVQQTYSITVTDKDGKACKASTTPTSSSGTTTSSTTSTASTSTASSSGTSTTSNPSTTQSKSYSISDYELGQLEGACSGKSAGQSCGTTGKEYCTNIKGSLFCMPQCIYYAATKQVPDVDSTYVCKEQTENCVQGTTRGYSCASTFVPGTFTCCKPKTES